MAGTSALDMLSPHSVLICPVHVSLAGFRIERNTPQATTIRKRIETLLDKDAERCCVCVCR